jgi:protein arginine kinase
MNEQNPTIYKNKNSRVKAANDKSDDQTIMTTRARIARNIAGFRFSSINNETERKEILDLVKNTFFSFNRNKGYSFYTMNKLSKTQRKLLVERHLISYEMTLKLSGKGFILRGDSSEMGKAISIMINEEDHLRIQSIIPGLNIYRSYNEISRIEKDLEKKLNFSYDKNFGYLTACPTNLGTSLRVSVIVHLPAIVVSSRVEEFIKKLSKINCTIRGYFGENSEVIGNLFQIANQVSLGKYEDQIIEEMNAICLNIIDEEKNAKDFLRQKKHENVEDSIFRSYGMLKYAKMLSFGESLELLSMLRLGLDIGVIKNIKPFDFHNLIGILGDSNILASYGKNIKLKSEDVDKIRASLIRERILKGFDENV